MQRFGYITQPDQIWGVDYREGYGWMITHLPSGRTPTEPLADFISAQSWVKTASAYANWQQLTLNCLMSPEQRRAAERADRQLQIASAASPPNTSS